MKLLIRLLLSIVAVFSFVVTACGGNKETEAVVVENRPMVVVTTNILGDVVENLVGDDLNVVTIMPVGTDPHDFKPSAQQVVEMSEAAAVIVNGAAFEEGLLDVIESLENDGVPVFQAISVVKKIEFDEDGHDEDGHDEDGHDEDGHDEHGHSGVDPHFFTDPARMAIAANAIANFLVGVVEGIDAETLRSNTDVYIDRLEMLDAEVTEMLSVLSNNQRVLVTNHEVFGYFADRYDFEIIGTVIPSGTTLDGTSAQTIASLVEIIEKKEVPAIFSDISSSDELIQVLADEVGMVDVIELFSESLGDENSDGSTYLEMVRANAERIVMALSS